MFERNWSFNLNINATYLDEYSYQLTPDRDVNQAVGHQNRSTGAVPPLPRIKGSLGLSWVNGRHSASITSHYLHELGYDGFQLGALMGGLHESVEPIFTSYIRRSHVEDIAYKYSGLNALGSEFNFTVGSRNAFGRTPQRMSDLGGTEGSLFDVMDRVI